MKLVGQAPTARGPRPDLLVVRPHAQDVDDPLILVHSINESVLNIDAAGVVAGQVTY